mgnify:FL=1
MKKQLCSLLTALALAVGLLPSAARAAENAPSFADVPAAAWYADAVQYVYENGLMTGVSESEFAPDGTATRGQIVTILWRLAGSPVVNYAMRYADADEGAWYGEAVRWAASTAISSPTWRRSTFAGGCSWRVTACGSFPKARSTTSAAGR